MAPTPEIKTRRRETHTGLKARAGAAWVPVSSRYFSHEKPLGCLYSEGKNSTRTCGLNHVHIRGKTMFVFGLTSWSGQSKFGLLTKAHGMDVWTAGIAPSKQRTPRENIKDISEIGTFPRGGHFPRLARKPTNNRTSRPSCRSE